MATVPFLLNPSSVRSPRSVTSAPRPVIPISRSVVSAPRSLNATWIGALLGVAFVGCTSTSFMGGHTSQAVLTALWQTVFGKGHVQDLGALNIVLRKFGHFLGHGLLSLVFCRAWYNSVRTRGIIAREWWRPTAGLLAVLTTLTVASLDELHQHFVPGRVGCVRDVLIDAAGALAANLVFLAIMTRRKPQVVQTYRRTSALPLAA
jgi:VanZ family protein